MIRDKTLTIVKGPSCLGVNFRLVIEHFRFLASNQTLSPLVKGVNPQLLCEDMTWQASLWVVRASSRVAMWDFRWDSTAGMEESEIKEERAQGLYPIMR